MRNDVETRRFRLDGKRQSQADTRNGESVTHSKADRQKEAERRRKAKTKQIKPHRHADLMKDTMHKTKLDKEYGECQADRG